MSGRHPLVSTSPTRRYACANPRCRGWRGRPRVVLEGHLAPGSVVVVPRCRTCGASTTIVVDAGGAWRTELRPAA